MPPPTRHGGTRTLTPHAVVVLAGIVILGVLIAFAAELAHTQSAARKSAITRFQDRAAVTSALVEAIFTSTTSSTDASKRYGSGPVTDRELGKAAKSGRLSYAAILDRNGAIIAASPGLPPAAAKHLLSRPGPVMAAVYGKPFTVSDVLSTGPNGAPVIELTQSLGGVDGRVAVSGVSPTLLNVILGAYLAKIPLRGSSHAYLVDRQGVVVASRDGGAPIGHRLGETGLSGAVAGHKAGPFDAHRYFVSTPVGQTPWRVVLTTAQSQLFVSVSGARKWTPWMIFAAFALAAAIALLLFRRMVVNSAKLALANGKLHEANKQLEGRNTLLKEAAELTRSNAELEQFASIASHDMQEPLRKVQTFAEQLIIHERDRLSEEGQDYLRRMSDAASRMRLLIEDLLTFSRVSTKGRPFATVDLGEVAHQVVIDLEVSIAEAHASVVVGDLPTISADRTQIRQLLQNLIANAIKFRRDGVPPEVRLSAVAEGGTVEVKVSDNGIGFDDKYGARIFRAFERLHARSDYPGTGIGLALCRKIVERHHGTISAAGTPDEGAVFTFTLPVEQDADAAPAMPGESDLVPEPVTSAHG